MSIRTTLFTVVSIVVVGCVLLVLCLRREIVSSDFSSGLKELTRGVPFNCDPFVHAELKISVIDGGRCLVSVRSLEDNRIREGWVNLGKPISFAPDVLGTEGVYIDKINGEKVYVDFHWGGSRSKYRLCWPWD